MSKVISGRGKIEFSKEKDKDKMEKKYPDVQFEKMNPLTFTTTYKGNKLFDLKIKVGDTVIPCSFKKFAWPWKYGSILALEPHFEDLGKKADIRISGGIQGKLFQFFRYDYEKMLKDNPQRQESIKLKSKISKLTNQQKKAIDAHLRQKYSYKKWAESLSDKADPELLKEYNKILKNPDFLENIKKTKKKGGGKTKVKPEEFKKMITEMEGLAMKENQKFNTSCYKIKTNFAKDKKKLHLKRKCHQGCEKKRMKTVKAFHKKYPKEFNVFVKSLGGGGSKKETKYICYDGIGSNKTGTHTEKEFLQVMKKNKDNFNENPPKNIKTADQWMKWAGAEKGRCKTKKKLVKLTDKQIRGKHVKNLVSKGERI